MRFRLKELFIATTVLCVFLAVAFTTPLLLSVTILLVTFLLNPVIWFVGACHFEGRDRAFFVGGIAAGVAPFSMIAIGATYMYMAIFTSGELSAMAQNDSLLLRVYLIAAWFAPGLFAFLGGGLGRLTHRLFCDWKTRFSSSAAPANDVDTLNSMPASIASASAADQPTMTLEQDG